MNKMNAPAGTNFPGFQSGWRNDWRIGGVVYQVFVDRFAPSARLEAKREHYAPPKVLRAWDEQPRKGPFLAEEKISQGELEFWGGDLESLRARLDYIQGLGAEVLYPLPIFRAFSNHKYDAADYFSVDPQYGTNAELKALVEDLHARGMRMMIDGAFNHAGRRGGPFEPAFANPEAPERNWFHFDESMKNGYRGWRNHPNLPEWNLENPEVRALFWDSDASSTALFLRDIGVDGWRLDCAPDVGPEYLAEITRAAHRLRPGSAVIGECWNYPEKWLDSLDGVLNMFARTLILEFTAGAISPGAAGRAMDRMLRECSTAGLLMSHLVLDNHDTIRLASRLPEASSRKFARALQFIFPGCPVIYYGSELGAPGESDPFNRATMPWNLVSDANEDLADVRRWTALRREHPALRCGSARVLDSERVLAFLRQTDRAKETLVAIANPGEEQVEERLAIRDSYLLDADPMECVLTGERMIVECGWARVVVPPRSVRLYRPTDIRKSGGYSMYKRIP